MVICVPSGITGVEQRAVQEAAEYAGARKPAYIIEEPMAAAIGAGLPVQEPTGNMIVDIGGGTTEVAVISLGGIVASQSVRVGGDELDDAIIQFIKKEYSLALGERTAEEVKIALGSAWPLEEELHAEIRGRDLVTGLPKTIVTTTEEIREAIEEPVSAIVDAVKVTLDKTPPELAADIMEQGIMLAGGGALLHGLDARLAARDRHADRDRPQPAALRGDRLRASRSRSSRRSRACCSLRAPATERPGPPWPSPGARPLPPYARRCSSSPRSRSSPSTSATPAPVRSARDAGGPVLSPLQGVGDRRARRSATLARHHRLRRRQVRERAAAGRARQAEGPEAVVGADAASQLKKLGRGNIHLDWVGIDRTVPARVGPARRSNFSNSRHRQGVQRRPQGRDAGRERCRARRPHRAGERPPLDVSSSPTRTSGSA